MIGGADNGQARKLHELGVQQNLAGHPRLAIRTLRRALAYIESRPAAAGGLPTREQRVLTARIWISLATSDSELNGLSHGLSTLTRAQGFVEQLADPSLNVVLQNQMGYMKVRGGLVEEGLTHLDRAVDLIEHADPGNGHAILLNRGTTHLFRGDLGRARIDLSRAAELAHQHQLTIEEVKARHNLGYLEFLAGNLATALRTMDAVLVVEADFSRAVVLLDRSRVLVEAGLHREADESLVEAEKLFRADRLWKDVAEVELARAECALIDGEIAAARRLAGSARDRFRRRANDRWRRDAELVLLQADVAAGRPGKVLAKAALRLAVEFRHEGLATRARTAQLVAAEAYLRAGRVSQAREVAALAGPVRPADPISARLHTRLVRAKLARSTGSSAELRREIRTGLAELARHRSRFGSLDLQTAGAVHGLQLAELDLALALERGAAAGVLAAVEQGRAISSRLQAVVAPADPEIAELLSDLRRTAEELRVIESDAGSAKLAAAHRKHTAEIQRTLRARAWQSEGSGLTRNPTTLASMLAALSESDTAFLSLVESGGQLHALLLGSGRPRVIALGAAATVNELGRRVQADLDVLANAHLPAPLRTAVAGALRRSLNTLDEVLLKPLGVANPRLVISPTGTLSRLPWGLLPSLRGQPIVVAPSATAWLGASSKPSADRNRTVAIFAGPDLDFAAGEARAIQAVWSAGRAFTGMAAQCDVLRAQIRDATLVHVAAHGRHQPENPLFSSLRLADGPVFAYEFDQTMLAAEHVVLSACELGQATIRPGDEALGWTSVLLHLGTRSVLAGVARVNDEVAADIMVRYHRLLATGSDSASALAEASLHSQELPAPFVCFGASWTAPAQVAPASAAAATAVPATSAS